ncbi:MAG: hypothetical protein KF865_12540 [Bdellovibrionaceae bacterium]|nr:hypothetical protein [Pseudobdellovibrionaceae bacterium]
MILDRRQKMIFFLVFMAGVIALSVGVYVSFQRGMTDLRKAEEMSRDIVISLKPYREVPLEGEALAALTQCRKENPYKLGEDTKLAFCQCYAVNGDPLKAMMEQDFLAFSAFNQALMRTCLEDVRPASETP